MYGSCTAGSYGKRPESCPVPQVMHAALPRAGKQRPSLTPQYLLQSSPISVHDEGFLGHNLHFNGK